MSLNLYSRASKQMGDFGELLVNYVLIKKGYEVAFVDHVGADLIAVRDETRYAISVKTRNFKKGSNESLMVVLDDKHIDKLIYSSKLFNLIPVIAFVFNFDDESSIEVYIIKIDDIIKGNALAKTKDGYGIHFSSKRKQDLINNPNVDYSF